MKKKLLLVLLLLGCLQSRAQFRNIKHYGESGPMAITFEDNTVRYGVVKNYHRDSFVLKGMAAQTSRQVVNTNLVANKVRFKETGQENFVELESGTIKKVTFLNDEGKITYEVERLKLAVIDLKTFEIKKTGHVFMEKLMNGTFETYGFSIFEGVSYMYTDSFIKVKGENYVVSLIHNTSFPSETKVFRVLEYVGRNCPAYLKYLQEVDTKGELVFRKEYKEAFKNFKGSKKELITDGKNDLDLSRSDAKERYKMMKDLYYIEFLEGKYGELCK